ncbi:MAG: glycosyl transferase [Caulobacteraceae bacterium]|nr:glycosyl transferase [Caulobacteraceae bacterium]
MSGTATPLRSFVGARVRCNGNLELKLRSYPRYNFIVVWPTLPRKAGEAVLESMVDTGPARRPRLQYSVLLPAHRDDELLLQAVRSVEHAIGADDAELIVIANGADRHAIVARLAGERPGARRRVLQAELPSLVHALNVGLEAASGDFIARMDSDDICLPDRFQLQMDYAERERVDFLFTEVDYIRLDGRPAPRRAGRWARHPQLEFPLFHPTAFIRRRALVKLGGYGNLEYAEDRHLWLQAKRNAMRFAKLPQSTIQYRIHEDQLTAERNKHATIAVSIGVDIGFGLRDGRPSLVLHGLFNAAVLVFNAIKRQVRRAAARLKNKASVAATPVIDGARESQNEPSSISHVGIAASHSEPVEATARFGHDRSAVVEHSA